MKKAVLALVLFAAFYRFGIQLASAGVPPPTISYSTPQSYPINTAITPVTPTSSGVAAQAYNQTGTTLATGFGAPSSVAVDAAGNVYVADGTAVYKITVANVKSVIGTGSFTLPSGVAVDASGNVFVADQADGSSGTVFEIPAGTITVNDMGGGNFTQPSIVAVDAAGNVYVVEGYTCTVLYPGSGYNPTNNFQLSISGANGMAVDAAGNVYFSTPTTVYKFPAGSTTPVSFSSGFTALTGIAVDAAGNVYVSDSANNCVKEIAPGTGTPTTLITGISGLTGIAIDVTGKIYVTDNGGTVTKFQPIGGCYSSLLPAGLIINSNTGVISGTPTLLSPAKNYTITAYNSTGSATATLSIAVNAVYPVSAPTISYPTPPAYYIKNQLITPLTATVGGGALTGFGPSLTLAGGGTPSTVPGVMPIHGATNAVGTAASFSYPRGVVSDRKGNLYVADNNNNLIRKIVISTGVVTTLAGTYTSGSANGTGTAATFKYPTGLAIDTSGTNLYVADYGNKMIRKIQISTGIVSTLAGHLFDYPAVINIGGSGTAAFFGGPQGLVMDPAGTHLYVADTEWNLIRQIIISTGAVSTLAGIDQPGTGFPNPNNYGYLDAPGTGAMFFLPSGIAIDPTGTNLYVADSYNNLIRKIVISTGVVSTVAGSTISGGGGTDPQFSGIYFANGTGTAASFSRPVGIATDPSGTNLYVTDQNNSMIRQIAISSGAVTTLAGTLTPGHANGIAAGASFFYPQGITLDNNGNIYVADFNHMIREIPAAGLTITPSLPAGLSFSTTTGYISGTPTAFSPATTYTITAANGGGTATATVSFGVGSTDATLSNLETNDGLGHRSFNESFASGTTSYTQTIYGSNTFLLATASQSGATIRRTIVGGLYPLSSPPSDVVTTSTGTLGSLSSSLAVKPGSTTVTYLVTAPDGITTKTYTVVVTKSSLGLTTLSIPSVTLSPSFLRNTLTYTSSVSYATNSITLTPTASVANQTIAITVNGGTPAAVTSGSVSGSINLNTGANTIIIAVTGVNGQVVSYTLTVTRLGVTTITSITPASAYTNGSSQTFTATFADAVTGLTTSNFSLTQTGVTGASITSVTGSGTTYTVTVNTGTGDGTIGVNLANATNLSLGISTTLPFAGGTTTVDKTAPTVTIGTPSLSTTTTGPVTYSVPYADANFSASTLTTSNITLNATGTATGTIGLTGSGTSYTVTLSSITGVGSLGISIAAATATDLAGNSAPASSASTTFTVTTPIPGVNRYGQITTGADAVDKYGRIGGTPKVNKNGGQNP